MPEFRVNRIVFLLVVLKGVLCAPPDRYYQVENHRRNWHGHFGPYRNPSAVNDRGDHWQAMCQEYLGYKPNPNTPRGNIHEYSQPTVAAISTKVTQRPAGPQIVLGEQLGITTPAKSSDGLCSPDKLMTHRFHKESGTCQELGKPEKGICNDLMTFYKDEDSDITGSCDCMEFEGISYKPIVYWQPQDRCYHLYEQGPCPAGKWLIQNGINPPSCTKRPCPENTEGPLKYWFFHGGLCYQTDTINDETKELCKSETKKLYHVANYTSGLGFLKCSETQILFSPLTRNLIGGVKDLPCKPGHKKSLNGECSRIAKFL